MARPDLFVHTLNSLRRGRTAEELSENLADAVAAARLTGKQASVTLTIKIKPERGTDGTYSIEDQVKAAIPEQDRGRTILFGTPEGNLLTQDPNQQDLELKDIRDTEPSKPLREVNHA
tara:strand:+ start:35630 stop:35983 length:354 start_codon:yes stop_codon:yes gene_type:complete